MNPVYFPNCASSIKSKGGASSGSFSFSSSSSLKKQIKLYNEQEIVICDKIKKIPNYSCFFSPILKYSLIQSSDKYAVIYSEELKPFYDYFRNCSNKERKYRIWSSYIYLIKGFKLLHSHEIFHGNYGKIGFNKENQPVLFDFCEEQESLRGGERRAYSGGRMPDEYERNMYNLSHFPIEMHIISFLEKDSGVNASLSKFNIETIFHNFLEDVQMECPDFLFNYVNKPKEQILDALWKYRYTWDNYALSMLYLEIAEEHQDGDDIDEIWSSFIEILRQSMNIDPEKRPSADLVLSRLSGFSGFA